MNLRDALVTRLLVAVAMLGTPRFRARLHIAILRSQGIEPLPHLIEKAGLARKLPKPYTVGPRYQK